MSFSSGMMYAKHFTVMMFNIIYMYFSSESLNEKISSDSIMNIMQNVNALIFHSVQHKMLLLLSHGLLETKFM
jgi:hypothetical protein